MALLTFSVTIALVLLYAVFKYVNYTKRSQLPAGTRSLPGPKGYPFIGSVPDLPANCSWLKFHDWAVEYGPIYQVNLAGTNHVWISTDKIANDLLAKRAAIYSDRPFIPALKQDNRTSGQYLPLMSKNALWQRQRKFAKQIMDFSKRNGFYNYPEIESKRLLVELWEDPSKYNHALESYISRVTARLAWGTSTPSDELKQRARELLIGVSPTGALGNKLPIVMGLPEWLSPAKAWEYRRERTEQKFFEIMQDDVRMKLAQAGQSPSWTRMFLEQKASWKFDSDLEGAYAVGMHGIAGALTIAAPMQGFCLAMIHYPQYQHILQEELDRVCGDRPPAYSDWESLPVLRAFIRETMRWRPPVPTGIPHELIQDDIYEGYFIPAKSVMHPLEWTISRDPDMFPDPEAFNPLRWLDPKYPTFQAPLTEFPSITNYSQFGYGRRTCQGMGVTDADLFVGIGHMAWMFHFSKDGDPEVMDDDSAYASGSETPPLNVRSPNGSFNDHSGGAYEVNCVDDAISPKEASHAASAGSFEDPVLPGIFPSSLDECIESEVNREQSHWKRVAAIRAGNGEVEPPVSCKNIGSDPTLDYTPLLIAKPYPFRFDLRVRKPERMTQIRKEFEESCARGEYEPSRVYWKNDNKGDKEVGWGAV